MSSDRRALGFLVLPALTMTATAVALVAFVSDSVTARLVVMGAVAALAGAYLAVVHPLLTLCGFTLVLTVAPYMDVPRTELPVLLVACAAVWVAILFLPGVRVTIGWIEAGMLLLSAFALLSVLATGVSTDALIELAAWLAATAVVVPLRWVSPEALRTIARTFVSGCCVSGAVGILVVIADPGGAMLARLAFLGYSTGGGNARQVMSDDGNHSRLTGTFVEPNIAGLILLVGLLLAIVYLTNWQRAASVALIGAALLLTLSRAAIGSLILALFIMVLFSRAHRFRLLLVGVASALASLAIPDVRLRLFDSFGATDTGSIARIAAFQDFPNMVAGHWWWGLGWAREEFRTDLSVNFVANMPLLHVYRAGLVFGLLVAVILVALTIRSLLVARRGTLAAAVLAPGLVGFIVVALQLDFPVVTQTPATAVFSVLVAFAMHRSSTERLVGEPESSRTRAVGEKAGVRV